MSYDPTYSPFPESELVALAETHERVAKQFSGKHAASVRLRAEHESAAKVCRNALASHVALRERMLIAEMGNRQAVPCES